MPELRQRGLNNFDGLRLAAAFAVLVGHSVPLTGRGDPPTVGGVPFFDLAVYAFFSMSGFLIATSWIDRPRPGSFLRRRALRIFPALIAVVMISVFVLGPTMTALRFPEYFSSPTTWSYLGNVTLFASYKLPGVFLDNPIGVVNGSLWTLGPEFVCYLLILAIGVCARLLVPAAARSVRLTSYLMMAATIGTVALAFPELGKGLAAPALAMVFFFAAAALAEVAHGRGPLPLWPIPVALALWAAGVVLIPGSIVVLGWLFLPYSLIALGQASVPVVRRAARFGDISYGVYLWAFPVQQVTWLLMPDAPLLLNVAVVAAATGAIGCASWHVIEKRAMGAARHLDRTRVSPAEEEDAVPVPF